MVSHVALKASAGSGKTFALTVRYISLLLLGAKPNEILTLTFTNKAANEMKQRILNTVFSFGQDSAYLEQIAQNTAMGIDEILAKKDFIQDLVIKENLAIYTIDKFINQILKEFGGYIGIFDSFDIGNDDIDELSFYFLKSLDKKSFSSFVHIYIHENKKLPSVMSLFKFFIQKESSLKFDLKVYEESLEDVTQDILEIANRLKSHIYQAYEEQMGVNAKRALEFDNLGDLLNKTWLVRDSLSEYRDLKKFDDAVSAQTFFELKSKLKVYFDIRSNNAIIEYLTLFNQFKEFRTNYILKKGYLEFSDITNFALKLVSELIDKEFLYFRLDSRYSHILIDEFQDTSIEQFNILLPMIEECLSGGDGFKTFFYVGDIKQSIYRFRGGNKELFDYILQSYPQVSEQTLDTNYRSKKEVVEFVNDTFIKLPNYEYDYQKSVKEGGYVEIVTDSNLEGDEPYLGLYEKLKELKQNGVDLNGTAILVSTNEEVLNIYHYLQRSDLGVEITTHMTSRLINQQNVKALINGVKYLFFKEDIYKVNTLSLIGKRSDEELVLEYDIKANSLEKTLYDIALMLGVIDENVIRLIENASAYVDIFDFVYKIDNLDASIQNSATSGISVLTIFKSKGLEYETVIVVDKLKRDSNKNEPFVFEYDGITLEKVHYKISEKEYFDESFANALDKEEALSIFDTINVQYVALTRAKSNLIVLKKEKSIFDILNLSDCKKGVLVQSEIKNTIENTIEEIEYKPLNLGLQELSIKSSNDEINNLKAKYFGIATHHALENAKDFSLDEIDFIVDISKQKFSYILENRDFIDMYGRIKMLFAHNDFQNLLQNSTNIKKEQPLAYNGEIKIIDLLVQKGDEYIIIDYKTGKEHHDMYIKQVSFYKKAISQITSSKNVKSYLCYILADKIEIINV